MTQDDSARFKTHGAKGKDSVGSQTGARYRKISTYDFKKDFSKILRQIARGDFDAAIITSYGRNVGVFMPHPDVNKKS